MLHCVIFLKTCNPKTSMSPSHHNFFVRHINISSGANHTFGASLTYFLPPFGCRQLPARTLHFNQPLLRTVHYFCYFICGSIRFLLLHLWFHNFHHITWYFLIFRHFNWCYSTPNTSFVVPKKRGLQTSRSIVPTKNDLEISICDSDFWSSSMSSDSIIRFGTI